MKKIILRKNILKRGFSSSALTFLTGGKKYSDKEKLIKDFGFKEVMKKLFDEEVESDNLLNSALYHSYSEILNISKEKDEWYNENDNFIELYRIDEEFVLQLDRNIQLYHLVPQKEFYTQIVPWYYADSKLYVGDTWWDQDEEIIESIQKLSIIDFLKKYKGY